MTARAQKLSPATAGGRGVVVAHTGMNAATRELLVGLDEHGLLDRFVTTLGFTEGATIARARCPRRSSQEARLAPFGPASPEAHCLPPPDRDRPSGGKGSRSYPGRLGVGARRPVVSHAA